MEGTNKGMQNRVAAERITEREATERKGKRNRHVLSHQRCLSEPCVSFLFIHKVCFVQIKLWPGTEGRGPVADGRTNNGAPGDRNQVCQWQTSGEFE